ncbi:MAG: TspO/MBR family protein [Elusimicrobiota bacterium]
MNNLIKLILSVLLCQGAGVVGGFITAKTVKTWYVTLNKPSFNPPDWVFGPVWTFLYLCMGVSLYLVWKESDNNVINKAVIVFLIQLVLNSLWSILFFGVRSPFLALIDIIFLLIGIALCIILFYNISKLAGYLMMPYFLWVCFAAVLNTSLWLMNK